MCSTCTETTSWRHWYLWPFYLSLIHIVNRKHLIRFSSFGMFKILGNHVQMSAPDMKNTMICDVLLCLNSGSYCCKQSPTRNMWLSESTNTQKFCNPPEIICFYHPCEGICPLVSFSCVSFNINISTANIIFNPNHAFLIKNHFARKTNVCYHFKFSDVWHCNCNFRVRLLFFTLIFSWCNG